MTTAPRNDPFAGEETGLADDFDATIVAASFGTDTRYNNGNTLLLKLSIVADDPEVSDRDLLYSCGNGWVTVDGGKTAKHETGLKRNFNENSAVRRFMRRMMSLPTPDGRKVHDLLLERESSEYGGDKDSANYVGFRFHFNNERQEYGANSGLEAKNRLMPTAFLGIAENVSVQAAPASVAAAAPTASAVSAPTASTAAAPAESGSAVSGALKVQLIKLAKSSPNVAAFIAAVSEMPEVLDNEAILVEMVDESADGFYARFGPK